MTESERDDEPETPAEQPGGGPAEQPGGGPAEQPGEAPADAPVDATTGKDSEKQAREADAAAAQQPEAEGPATPPVAASPQAQTSEPAAGAPVPSEEARGDGAPLSETEEVTLLSQGFLVEFDSEAQLMAAAARVRDAGYAHWDCHTPYPVHGLDAAMGVKPTILPWLVLGGGLTGVTVGMILQLYTNGIQLPFSMSEGFVGTFIWPFLPSGYPYVVSGKPVFSVPANIPVAFELTILFSAFGAFFGMWGLNKLPRFWHPVFHSARFRRATDDRYFISIESEDALYDRERTRFLAESLGGIHVEELLGEED